MPTLPLYTPTHTADASRRVAAPGGYERWRFDGESASGDVRFVAVLGVGSPFSPDYRRRYDRYRRRPTRYPPPVPADYPFAHFAVYEGQRLLSQFTTHYPAGDYTASVEPLTVKVGPNEYRRAADGTFSVTLRESPSRGACDALSARLAFRPRWPSTRGEAILASRVAESEHFWGVTDPLCDVSGTIVIPGGKDASAGVGRHIKFSGRGYHDHEYGTAPLATVARRRFGGRVLLGDSIYAFTALRPHDRAVPDDVHMLRYGPDGDGEMVGAPPALDWTWWAHLPRPYPRELTYRTRLRLWEPRVIDSTPEYVRLIYRAGAEEGRESGTALCEVEHLRGPRR